jgi:hypothetical protein
MNKLISCAVVMAASTNPYLLVGKQGTNNQGKIAIQGVNRLIPYKDILGASKSAYAAAVPGVFQFPIADGTYIDKKLVITIVGELPSEPLTKKKFFANASIGSNESLTDEQWLARCVATINNNPTIKQLFTASISGQNLVLTQVIPGNGEVFVDSSVSSIVVTETTVGALNRGMTGAQVLALINNVNKGYNVTVIGAPNYATSNYDMITIDVANFSTMKPFGFKENAPESILLLIDTSLTTWESNFDNLMAINSSFNPTYGTALFTDAAAEESDDLITKAAHGLNTDDLVVVTQVTNGTGLYAGLVAYVKRASSSTFSLSLTPGGANINISLDGTGVGIARATNAPLIAGDFSSDATAAELLAPPYVQG